MRYSDDFEEAAPPSFDPDITVHVPRHDAARYTKALDAVKEQIHLAWIESLPHEARRIVVGGCMIALDREREPDKPGTVRKPGIRRVQTTTVRKKRWSGR